ncbi:hypothetical protein KY312_03490, partial [Candidatus Woesearchaeota archaeon]|nr:hypothetical protein [Candidatus Woesearchaeota archaeon]
MTKQLNILDLNGKDVTIRLKDKYLNKIKNQITNNGGFYKVGKSCNLNYTVIYQAAKKNNIPLYMLNIIKDYFNLKNIERHIDAYKSYKGRTWIEKPKLVIKESPILLEILGHCIGDGYITLKKSQNSTYTNTSKKLVKDFKILCKQVFGNVELTTYSDRRCDAETVIIPRIITSILTKFFPGVCNKKISSHILNLPKKKIIPFIRAFADDESCVTTSAICYVQKDKETLEYIRKFHLLVGFREENLTQIKEKSGIYKFSIKGKGLKYFHENVRYKHPDKINYLEVEVKRKRNKRKINTIDTTKKEITEFLNTPKTIRELSASIGRQPNVIIKHMKKLKEEGYVKRVANKKYKNPI